MSEPVQFRHQPVLLVETIHYLNPRPNQNFIDCTLGGGGHAVEILAKTGPQGKLLGLDLDPAALEAAKLRLQKYSSRITTVQGNYRQIKNIINETNFNSVHGVLLDLGLSLYQLEKSGRGFAHQIENEFLDLRFEPGGQPGQRFTAWQVINSYPVSDLAEILGEYGEIQAPRHLAKFIVDYRQSKRINTTTDLKTALLKFLPNNINFRRRQKFLSQVWQALRIEVNDELNGLQEFLPQTLDILQPGGRLVIISFHSLEDRLVKNFFRQHPQNFKILTKKPIRPSAEEIKQNPPSRSAKLRASRKI